VETDGLGIQDVVGAQLVDCAPDVDMSVKTSLPAAPDASPTRDAMQATIEQTGADPPPSTGRD